jgi:hypothetical protein
MKSFLYHIEFPHICNIYDDNIIFILIYGDLPMIHFIWFITLQNRKTPFCVYFTFREIYGVKLTWDFWSIIFSSAEAPWALEAHMERPEGRKRPGGVPSNGGRATLALSVVDRPIALILSPTNVFCPKNHYIYGPEEFSGEGGRTNTQTRK